MKLHYKNLSLEDIIYVDEDWIERVEEWRDMPDYEGLYQISDLGRVKSLSREVWNGKGILNIENKILKQHTRSSYLQYVFRNKKNKKCFKTHQLVAIMFLNHKPCGLKLVVDHKNGNPLDNKLSNLQIITNRQNISKAIRQNKTGNYVGVRKRKDGKFESAVQFKGKRIYLGRFLIEEEASEYYQNALKAIENGEEIISARKVKTSIHKGVYFDKSIGKYASRYKSKIIGRFSTEIEAFEAREYYIKNLNLQE